MYVPFFYYICIMEVFKDIKGYEGLYQVSNQGRVKSFAKWRGSSKPRILSFCANSNGYYTIGLNKNGKRKTMSIHVLVAMVFLGYKPNGQNRGLVCDHINNDKLDNRVENLRIITPRENSPKRLKKYTSKYVGVSWRKDRNKWTARININNVYKHLGNFKNEYDAYLAYQNALSQI